MIFLSNNRTIELELTFHTSLLVLAFHASAKNQRIAGSSTHRITGFALPQALNILLGAITWYIDGTYSIAEKPYHVLITIHAEVCHGECAKQLLLFFVLMTHQTESDNNILLKEFLNSFPSDMGPPLVGEIMMDFEIPVWHAFKKVLPEAKICRNI